MQAEEVIITWGRAGPRAGGGRLAGLGWVVNNTPRSCACLGHGWLQGGRRRSHVTNNKANHHPEVGVQFATGPEQGDNNKSAG